ncbi:hypothetical protein SBOR_7642 [Sclerotinia borealis F-4128]|uniref:Uncharacterized protein n=1 Tax=Sclerotinia borealis (strain F-4128) TaxID=1432307 RepID=W9CBQ7_SCLBF|nr:hypothetical protein SBOR_7642 [Sclerotinia borealis F-4128]
MFTSRLSPQLDEGAAMDVDGTSVAPPNSPHETTGMYLDSVPTAPSGSHFETPGMDLDTVPVAPPSFLLNHPTTSESLSPSGTTPKVSNPRYETCVQRLLREARAREEKEMGNSGSLGFRRKLGHSAVPRAAPSAQHLEIRTQQRAQVRERMRLMRSLEFRSSSPTQRAEMLGIQKKTSEQANKQLKRLLPADQPYQISSSDVALMEAGELEILKDLNREARRFTLCLIESTRRDEEIRSAMFSGALRAGDKKIAALRAKVEKRLENSFAALDVKDD